MKRTLFNTSIRLILLFTLSVTHIFTGCTSNTSTENETIKKGFWRVVLQTQGQEIPFIMEADKKDEKQVLYIINGEERILLDEITQQGDSVSIALHIFDAELVAKIQDNKMHGRFIKHDLEAPFSIPFTAEHGQKNRFEPAPSPPSYNFTGKWEVVFTNKAGENYKAIGIFKQTGSNLTGTFLTETGDYRYLEGQVKGDQLRLSTFDGNHAYLFTAIPSDTTTLEGEFYAGLTDYETWTAKRNEQATLANANSLTYLKPGYKQLSFTFPNLKGEPVSLSDPKYKDKVVIVQLLGSWCPNCLDETKFLLPFYAKNKDRGLEIIGLGFERSPEFEKAAARLQKMKDRLHINYDMLVAGTSDKENAASVLPALNHVLSFPTTIFIDRKGNVRKIHTGFSGPGTGKYYEDFVKDFNTTIDKLLAEN
jgi:peroxiredoxin